MTRLSCLSALLALLAGLALLAPVAAHAQPTIDLVSNMSAGTATRGPAYQAQSFRTGSDAIEYSVTGVQLRFDEHTVGRPPGASPDDLRNVSVKIRKDANGFPGALVATLTGSGGYGVRTFTAPANTTLDANTTYWVVVNEGSPVTVVGPSVIASNSESGLPGWTIGNAQNSHDRGDPHTPPVM